MPAPSNVILRSTFSIARSRCARPLPLNSRNPADAPGISETHAELDPIRNGAALSNPLTHAVGQCGEVSSQLSTLNPELLQSTPPIAVVNKAPELLRVGHAHLWRTSKNQVQVLLDRPRRCIEQRSSLPIGHILLVTLRIE